MQHLDCHWSQHLNPGTTALIKHRVARARALEPGINYNPQNALGERNGDGRGYVCSEGPLNLKLGGLGVMGREVAALRRNRVHGFV